MPDRFLACPWLGDRGGFLAQPPDKRTDETSQYQKTREQGREFKDEDIQEMKTAEERKASIYIMFYTAK